MSREVIWGSPTWGQPGHNVHLSANGSDVAQCPKEEL